MSLDWPDPVVPPPPPAPIHVPVVDDREPAKRKKMQLWDRVKFLILLVGLFWFFVWAEISDNPILPFGDAVRETAKHKWYLFVLFGVEVIRQIHYLISEHWARYNRFWTEKVFGGIARRTGRLKDYTRYRLARVFKAIAFLVILSLILGQFFDLPPATALFELPSRFFDALPFILQMSFYLLFAVGQFAAIFWFLSRGGVDTYFPDDIKTRYSDVWGQDAVLERVKENMMYLEEPEKIEEKGGYVPGGILLWGPPGTGKTLMAEAVAGETGKPYVFVDPGAFTNMFMGVGILKVKSLFRKLRKLALRYGGVIVFYDEADSLGNRGSMTPGFGGQVMSPSAWGDGYDDLRWLSPESQQIILRSSLSSSTPHDTPGRRRDGIIAGMGMGGGGMGTLQALLTEMSGLKKPRGFINRHVRRALGMRPKPPPKYRILTMMATNMPQALDEALLRPVRLDRIYKVGYPSKEGRKRTYWGYLDKVQHALTEADVDKLATITPYATGAIIKDTVNEALITAIRNGRDTITWPDVIKAKHLKELGPPEDVEYIRRERHAVAIHEACHAVAAYRIRHHLTIDLATIEKGGTYLGMVSSIKPEDQFTHWRTEYESDIIVSLASLAGERMFFEGDNSSGVSGDLESATTIATLMEGYWGMGSTVASHAITQKVGVGGGGRPGGGDEKEERELLKGSLGERIEENLAELLRQAERLLTEHRLEVLAVAHALETHKTLAGEDVVAVIEGRQGSIVDGRPYKTEAFAEQAEAYHAMAVSAHRDHASVEIPLPKLNGHVHELIEVAGVAHENGHENGSSRASTGEPLPPPAER
jgi:ATP-dependent Zn protease